MLAMPVVGVLGADTCEIGPVALRTPLEGLVVHALGGERIRSVTLHLVAQAADHLRMAIVAAFAHVDVAAREFERGVGTHPFNLLDRALEVEERQDLDETADGNHDQNADHEDDGVLLEDLVLVPE